MLARIERLGERMLTRLVPRVQASAQQCYDETCGYVCVTRRCCNIPVAPWKTCGYCEWTC